MVWHWEVMSYQGGLHEEYEFEVECWISRIWFKSREKQRVHSRQGMMKMSTECLGNLSSHSGAYKVFSSNREFFWSVLGSHSPLPFSAGELDGTRLSSTSLWVIQPWFKTRGEEREQCRWSDVLGEDRK